MCPSVSECVRVCPSVSAKPWQLIRIPFAVCFCCLLLLFACAAVCFCCLPFQAEVGIGARTVTIMRVDLNHHFTVREIIKASQDGYLKVVHDSGLSHLEFMFLQAFSVASVKGRFIKEIEIHSKSRQTARITRVCGPFISILVQFIEVHEDGSDGDLAFEVTWTIFLEVEHKNQSLVYDFEAGSDDTICRYTGMFFFNLFFYVIYVHTSSTYEQASGTRRLRERSRKACTCLALQQHSNTVAQPRSIRACALLSLCAPAILRPHAFSSGIHVRYPWCCFAAP